MRVRIGLLLLLILLSLLLAASSVKGEGVAAPIRIDSAVGTSDGRPRA